MHRARPPTSTGAAAVAVVPAGAVPVAAEVGLLDRHDDEVAGARSRCRRCSRGRGTPSSPRRAGRGGPRAARGRRPRSTSRIARSAEEGPGEQGDAHHDGRRDHHVVRRSGASAGGTGRSPSGVSMFAADGDPAGRAGRRHRHRHDEPAGAQERGQPDDVRRAPRRVPVDLGRPRTRPGRGRHRRRGQLLLGRRSRRRSASVADAPAAWMRQVGETCVGAARSCPSRSSPRWRASRPAPGRNLALGCDLVVAAEDARFSEIFARRGLSIDFGGSCVLPRLVGLHKAKELALLRRHHLGQGGARARAS